MSHVYYQLTNMVDKYMAFSRTSFGDRELTDRFAEKVEVTDDCWLWKSSTNDQGYGTFWFEGRAVNAHQIAFRLSNGPLGDKQVNHHCDVKPCVNPDHLYAGTQSRNVEEVYERTDRTQSNEENGNSKLSVEQVKRIKERLEGDESQREIASDFPVKRSTISNISTGKQWSDVQP